MKFEKKEIRYSGFLICVLIIASLCLGGCGHKEPKVYRVGILSGLEYFAGIPDEFKKSMSELGYIEGENIAYDIGQTNFEPEKEKEILEKFVENQVDLILAFPTDVALAAKEAVKDSNIPLVFVNALTDGLIEDLRAPGGNITGVRYPNQEITIKRFEMLQYLLPSAKRIFLPYQKDYPTVSLNLEVLRQAASSSGVALIEFPADDLAQLRFELERRESLGDAGFDFDAVFYMPESLSTRVDTFELIAKHTRDRKIPIAGTIIRTDDYGTVFGVSPLNSEMAKQSAYLAKKILNGMSAGTIPIISADQYLRINYKVSQELEIQIPQNMLNQAKEIIK